MPGLPERDAPVYPIGSVEKLTGLTARQIRYYETKGLVRPARTPGNQRCYSASDVERLLLIKDLLEQGYNLKSIGDMLAEAERAAAAPTLDDYPAKERLVRGGLRSLYPVSDHARLMQILERDAARGRRN